MKSHNKNEFQSIEAFARIKIGSIWNTSEETKQKIYT